LGTRLDTVTVDTFAAAVGDAFPLDLGESGQLPLELTEAKAYEGGEGFTERRTPFALRFRGPVEPLLPQGTYRLEHASIGPLEIFIVPLGVNAEGTRYEAIFT
jgi:uncharacterized protein DUF6916